MKIAVLSAAEALEFVYAWTAFVIPHKYLHSFDLANHLQELLVSYLTSLGVEEIKLSTKKHIRKNLLHPSLRETSRSS